MRSTLFSLAAAATFVAAQSLEGLPDCALPCVEPYISGDAVAGCAQLDIGCICSNENFLGDIACCLADACDDKEQQVAITFANKLCSGAGVDVPDTIECSTTASGSGTAASTQAPTSTATSDDEEATSSATESAAAAETSADDSGAQGLSGGVLGAIVAMLFAL